MNSVESRREPTPIERHREGASPVPVTPPAALQNAMVTHAAFGGSTNLIMHLAAVAHSAGLRRPTPRLGRPARGQAHVPLLGAQLSLDARVPQLPQSRLGPLQEAARRLRTCTQQARPDVVDAFLLKLRKAFLA